MRFGTPLERFHAKIQRVDNGCWIWVGGKKKAGYGQFFVDGHKVIAHRWAYAHFVGPIPEGHEVDHLCQEESCVNPEHLEAVTVQENRRRRVTAKTRCVNGHEYTPENTYRYFDHSKGYNSRRCRKCNLAVSTRLYHERKAS